MRLSLTIIILIVGFGSLFYISLPPDQNILRTDETHVSIPLEALQNYYVAKDHVALLTEKLPEKTKTLHILDKQTNSHGSLNLGKSSIFDINIFENEIILSYIDNTNKEIQILEVTLTGEIEGEYTRVFPFNSTIIHYEIKNYDNTWVMYAETMDQTLHEPVLYRITNSDSTIIARNFHLVSIMNASLNSSIILGHSQGLVVTLVDSPVFNRTYSVDSRNVPIQIQNYVINLIDHNGEYSLSLHNSTHQLLYDIVIYPAYVDLVPSIVRSYSKYLSGSNITITELSRYDSIDMELKTHQNNLLFYFTSQYFTIEPERKSSIGKYYQAGLHNSETDRISLYYITTGDRITINTASFQLQHTLSNQYPMLISYLLYKTSVFFNLVGSASILLVCTGIIFQLLMLQAYPEHVYALYRRIWSYYLSESFLIAITMRLKKKYDRVLRSHVQISPELVK